jgi:uncharacterized MAPEG superfamily protein
VAYASLLLGCSSWYFLRNLLTQEGSIYFGLGKSRKQGPNMSLPENFSILSIPVYYAFSFLPHAYAIRVATQGRAWKWDNRNPRSSALKADLRSKLDQKTFALYERAEAASSNAYENMPLFTAAVLIGHVMRLDKKYLNNFALQFLLVRAAHTISYVSTSKQKWTFLRTFLYIWSVGLCIRVIVRAAKNG